MLTGNLKENYRKFKQQFQIYLTAAGISNLEEEVKCATLLHVIGPDAIKIFNTFRWSQEGDTPRDDKKLDKVLSKFEIYCTRYIDAKEPIREKLLFLSPIRSRKGAYQLKTTLAIDSDIKR